MDSYTYNKTFDEHPLITFALGTNVKKKIKEKFDSDPEDFIEKEFPQDKELEVYFFKYSRKDNYVLALKTDSSDYMLLIERSKNRYTDKSDNYMYCFDIQRRPELRRDESNDFISKTCEIKIPIEFNRRYYDNSTSELLDDIEKQFHYMRPYTIPSLDENEEFKKWYAYLTLLEKLIDAKDFYFEADLVYSEKKAKVDLSHIKDKELLEKIKKARTESFLYYSPDEVDTKKLLHEWDEQDNRNRNFGVLKENKDNVLSFNLDEEFIRKFKSKSSESEIVSSNYDTNDFIVNARQYIETSIKKINQNIVYVNNEKIRINATHSIKNLTISQDEKNKLIDVWKKLSSKNHDSNAEDVNKEYVNDVLGILKGILPITQKNSKSFNPPGKLILRVSYFRDQFQLKTLKKGLDQIQNHPLKAYLFGDKKISKIDDDELNSFEIEYLSKLLNDKQKEAIKKALISHNIFMIQGPPGTGKTEVISEIAYQEAIRGKKVLITSQANMAVDNALQRLNHPSLYPVRIIRKDYEPEDGDSLPVEANIGSFYQDRIISNLTSEIKAEQEERKSLERFIEYKDFDDGLINIVSKLKIEIPPHLDLSNDEDKDAFKSILYYKKNRDILEKRVEKLIEKAYYTQIQNDFLEELKNDENQEIEEEKGYLTSNYMKNVNIWGATLFETGKYSFKDLFFDVVIVDEVSKAMPPELVLPILKAKKLILVGDHKQLPPIVKDVSLEDLAYETGISMDSLDFETTVFEKLIINNPQSYVMLNKQYRMHPHIQKAINQFYINDENKAGLECGLVNPDIEKCHRLQDKIFKSKHLVWLKTKSDHKEQKDGTSYKNNAEVDGIQTTLKYLNEEYKKMDKKPSVGVITFYGKQLGELSKLEKRGFWNLPLDKRNYPNLDLRFGTVDRFQGQEKDIIIVSLVRNNNEHNVGFAKKPHRVNVAFSRARNLLIIVGNVDNFRFSRDEKSAKQYGEIFNIAKKYGTVQRLGV